MQQLVIQSDRRLRNRNGRIGETFSSKTALVILLLSVLALSLFYPILSDFLSVVNTLLSFAVLFLCLVLSLDRRKTVWNLSHIPNNYYHRKRS